MRGWPVHGPDVLVGGAEVMIEQIDHLLTLAQQDNITIQVLSFGAGEYPHNGWSGEYPSLQRSA
ncbi:Scr1 family TA system antitoxin-like transcriptional regulator [Saccharothrix sp. ALI-22-I]|uniref:Scr1 family TA system antitoxin-like transcriptional regulator n=1 Tax=Saccharothrix sp. ALI-22-I TaxID=1933778 RepID=UPI002379D78D|nr:Scr1 family TA system antitoxin-like transcriptional regulator [Saccharothrix sp. ALI-22-I]